MNHSSYIELSKSALKKNIKFLTNIIGKETKLCSVVKGNAYGHGISSFIPLAESIGIHDFAVSNSEEALKVLSARKKKGELMIMSHIDNESMEWAIDHGISFYIFDKPRLEKALVAARLIDKKARIHLELETGLNRTGFPESELDDVITFIKKHRQYFEVVGICTHYAGAESTSNYFRINKQIETFNRISELLRDKKLLFKLRHSACSAAALTREETIMDMARIGIAQYGYWPSEETKMQYLIHNNIDITNKRIKNPLRRMMTWKTRIMSMKDVGPGSFVSYGNHYMTTRRQRIASIPIGYYHGFPRNLSNYGHVLVRGKRARVAGIVNMNLMMVDVTDIPGVENGDEVVIIGKQKKSEISVNSFSDMSSMLNYEVLVRIPPEIPRVIVE